MPIVRHFFAEGLEKSEVMPPVMPGTIEHMRDLTVGGLGRLIVAECAKDDSFAKITCFSSITHAVEGADLYLPLEIVETEFERELGPKEEVTIPIKLPSLISGGILHRLDPTPRHKFLH